MRRCHSQAIVLYIVCYVLCVSTRTAAQLPLPHPCNHACTHADTHTYTHAHTTRRCSRLLIVFLPLLVWEKSFVATSDESLKEACEEERRLLLADGVDSDESELATRVTFDGSWPKRYGHNSQWGFSSMRSRMSKLILGVSLKFKQCSRCDAAARRRDTQPDYSTPPHACNLAGNFPYV